VEAGVFSLSWDNLDPVFLHCQKLVFDAIGLPVNQHRVDGFRHWDWMEWVLRYHRDIDIFVFIDADAVPKSRHAVEHAIAAAMQGRVFGCAQAANHLETNRDHVYAGPFFMALARSTWQRLGEPSFAPAHDRDVAQGLTLAAQAQGCEVELWQPSEVELPRWRLGATGQFFGIGTTYGDQLYHLFESRGGQHLERFVRACERIVRGRAVAAAGVEPPAVCRRAVAEEVAQ
jgi:hypothetical protein